MVVFMGDNWIATEMTSCTNPAAVSSVGTTIGAGVTIGATLEGVMDGTAVVVVTFLAMVGATVVATGASVVEGVVTTTGASVVEGVVTTTGDSVVEGVVTTAGASVVVEGVVTTTAGAAVTTGDSVDGSTMFGAAVGGTATTILHWEQSPKTTKVRVKTSAEPSFKQV